MHKLNSVKHLFKVESSAVLIIHVLNTGDIIKKCTAWDVLQDYVSSISLKYRVQLCKHLKAVFPGVYISD